MQDGKRDVVSNPVSGLCTFHAEHGEKAVKPRVGLDYGEAERRMLRGTTDLREPKPAPPRVLVVSPPAPVVRPTPAAPAPVVLPPPQPRPQPAIERIAAVAKPPEVTRLPVGVAKGGRTSQYHSMGRRFPQEGIRVTNPDGSGTKISILPLELSRIIADMIEKEKLTVTQISQRLCIGVVMVGNIRNLQHLCPDAKRHLGVPIGETLMLPLNHAFLIARLLHEDQQELLEHIVVKRAPVSRIEKLVKAKYALQPREQVARSYHRPRNHSKLLREYGEALEKVAKKVDLLVRAQEALLASAPEDPDVLRSLSELQGRQARLAASLLGVRS